MTIATVGYRPAQTTQSTDGLDNIDVHIDEPSTGSDVLEVIGIVFATIFTLGIFWAFFKQSRLVFDNFSEKDEAALRAMGRDIARSPDASARLRAHYQALRRDQGDAAIVQLQAEVYAALVRANPHMAASEGGRTELNLAARFIAQGMAQELDPVAPAPRMSEGFDSLTRELESTTVAPHAVVRAQGEGFARFPAILHEVTRRDEGRSDAAAGNLLAGLFLMGLTWGAAVRAEREATPGVITREELDQIRERARYLAPSDRTILATVLQQMTARQQVVLSGTNQAAIDALVTELMPTPASPSEQSSGKLIASLATLEYVLEHVRERSGALESGDETLLNTLASQLTADLGQVPPSVQRLAREFVQQRLARVPATTTSPSLTRLRTLFPAANS